MFRNVRKINRAVTEHNALEIIKKCNYGVMGTIGEDGYPYVVPLNYIYTNEAIYFHCGKNGHKIDNIKFCDKVSFSVVAYEDIDEEDVSTDYESVTLFGKASIVQEEESLIILKQIMADLVPSHEDSESYINKYKAAAYVVKINIEHITGKARLDKKNKKCH